MCADSRTSRWQAQFPGHDLIEGSLLQFFDPSGHVTYNGGGNYVDAFGRDLGSGQYTRCGDGFKTHPGDNAWGFFGASRKAYFDCDVAITSACTAVELRELRTRLPGFLDSVCKTRVGLAIYNAGTDVFADDPLGGLNISASTIRERDPLPICPFPSAIRFVQ